MEECELQALSENSDINGLVIWGAKNHAVCNNACEAKAGQQLWLDATWLFLS